MNNNLCLSAIAVTGMLMNHGCGLVITRLFRVKANVPSHGFALGALTTRDEMKSLTFRFGPIRRTIIGYVRGSRSRTPFTGVVA